MKLQRFEDLQLAEKDSQLDSEKRCATKFQILLGAICSQEGYTKETFKTAYEDLRNQAERQYQFQAVNLIYKINEPTPNEFDTQTLLTKALLEDRDDIADYLIEQGAIVRIEDVWASIKRGDAKQTTFHRAAFTAQLVEKYLEAKAAGLLPGGVGGDDNSRVNEAKCIEKATKQFDPESAHNFIDVLLQNNFYYTDKDIYYKKFDIFAKPEDEFHYNQTLKIAKTFYNHNKLYPKQYLESYFKNEQRKIAEWKSDVTFKFTFFSMIPAIFIATGAEFSLLAFKSSLKLLSVNPAFGVIYGTFAAVFALTVALTYIATKLYNNFGAPAKAQAELKGRITEIGGVEEKVMKILENENSKLHPTRQPEKELVNQGVIDIKKLGKSEILIELNDCTPQHRKQFDEGLKKLEWGILGSKTEEGTIDHPIASIVSTTDVKTWKVTYHRNIDDRLDYTPIHSGIIALAKLSAKEVKLPAHYSSQGQAPQDSKTATPSTDLTEDQKKEI